MVIAHRMEMGRDIAVIRATIYQIFGGKFEPERLMPERPRNRRSEEKKLDAFLARYPMRKES